MRDQSDVTIGYDHQKKLYIKSGLRVGQIIIYNNKASATRTPSILVNLGEIAEAIRAKLAKLLGKPVRFYTKHNTLHVACFLNVVKNIQQERCVKVVDNQSNTLIPIDELDGRFCKFWAVLKAGMLKENDDKSFSWSISAFELNVKDVTEDDECYKDMIEPTVYFADQE